MCSWCWLLTVYKPRCNPSHHAWGSPQIHVLSTSTQNSESHGGSPVLALCFFRVCLLLDLEGSWQSQDGGGSAGVNFCCLKTCREKGKANDLIFPPCQDSKTLAVWLWITRFQNPKYQSTSLRFSCHSRSALYVCIQATQNLILPPLHRT